MKVAALPGGWVLIDDGGTDRHLFRASDVLRVEQGLVGSLMLPDASVMVPPPPTWVVFRSSGPPMGLQTFAPFDAVTDAVRDATLASLERPNELERIGDILHALAERQGAL